MTRSRKAAAGGVIDANIQLIRGQRVMLSPDLAKLYDVSPKALGQAVTRNAERFPEDFMFRLTLDEAKRSRSQIVTLKKGESLRSQFVTLKRGAHVKHPPYAFTEQGVAMLSSVLRSDRAVRVNIAIMRAFVRLRGIQMTNKELTVKLMDLELRTGTNETSIMALLAADQRSRRQATTD